MRKFPPFNPIGKSFCFRMDKYTCFLRKHGKCSLDLTDDQYEAFSRIDDEIYSDNFQEMTDKSSVHYCRALAKDFKSNGINKPIDICNNTCGHYSINFGQHRACIARRVNITAIPVRDYDENDGICVHCDSKKREIIYRLQAWLNKSFWYIG